MRMHASFPKFCHVIAEYFYALFKIMHGQEKFLCDKLRPSLIRELQDPQLKQVIQASLALAQHNLKNNGTFPTLFVRASPDLRLWRVALECMLTAEYPGAEIIIFNEGDSDFPLTRAPDIAVFTIGEGDHDPAAKIAEYASRYSSTSRLVVVTTSPLPTLLPPQAIIFSTVASLTDTTLYVPQASVAFAASMAYSPLDLLRPARVVTSKVRHFCIGDYLHRSCGRPHRDYFFRLLNELDQVQVLGSCDSLVTEGNRVDSTNISNSTLRFKAIDRKIEAFRQFKFVLAFKDALHNPGMISDTIVVAFIAGAVPIYYGHSPTMRALFDAKAFVDCGSFPSLRACANHVLAVHALPTLYDAMQSVPTVAKRTAFLEAFLWHPQVAELATDEGIL